MWVLSPTREVPTMPYKVVMTYPDGETDEMDEEFDTYEEADEYGLECCSNYETGGEILYMSNPGDYPLEDGEADYDVIEV